MKYKLIWNVLISFLLFSNLLKCSFEKLDDDSKLAYLSALQRLSQGFATYITTPPSSDTSITLTTSTVSSSSIQLTWTALTSAVNYRVYRSTTSGFTPTAGNEVVSAVGAITLIHPRGNLITPLGDQTTSARNSSGLTAATRYYYKIAGIKSNGSVVYSNEASSVPESGLTVRTHAGSGAPGNTNGTGYEAKFYFPQGLSVDSSGFIYLADSGNHLIRRISPRIGDIVTSGGVNYALEGLATTFAGVGTWGNTNSSIPSNASFFEPWSTCVIGTDVYVADSANHSIRQITSDGVVTTLAGSNSAASGSGNVNATGTTARFNYPQSIVCFGTNIYVADTYNNAIRVVSTAGVVTTLAGTPAGSTGQSGQGSTDATGTAARFYLPRGITIDSGGTNLYVSDTGNHTIRQVTTGGVVTTLAGTAGIQGKDDGTAGAASFAFPRGITFSSGTSSIYVADSANHLIRRVTTGGIVTTVAGTGQKGGVDGLGVYASFWFPQGITYSAVGNACPCLYVSDTENHKIRRITGSP